MNAKKEVISLAIVLTLLAALAFHYQKVKTERTAFRNSMQELAKSVHDESSSRDDAPTDSPLLAGSPERGRLFSVRKAYDTVDFDGNISPETLSQLTDVARGLNDNNPVVRQTTEDIVRHMLTKWVRSHSPEQWHRSGEIDAFFRVFRNANSRSLNRFLKVIGDGPESRYLAEIKEES